jgi:hypothetical protein
MARGIYDADANNVVDTVQSLHWNDIMSKPLAFPPLPHTHLISDVTGLSNALATFITTDELPEEVSAITYTKTEADALLGTKANVIHFHDDRYYLKAYVDTVTSPSGIDSSLAIYQEEIAPEGLAHNHDERYYDKAYIDDTLNTSNISLVNDARYYTKPEVDSAIATRAPLVHNHNDLYYTKDQINGFFATVGDGLYVYTPGTAMAEWDIYHGLGRYPTVNVVVSGELALAKVIYPDPNSLTVRFSSPQTGNAYLT